MDFHLCHRKVSDKITLSSVAELMGRDKQQSRRRIFLWAVATNTPLINVSSLSFNKSTVEEVFWMSIPNYPEGLRVETLSLLPSLQLYPSQRAH